MLTRVFNKGEGALRVSYNDTQLHLLCFSGSALLVHPVTAPQTTVIDVFLPGSNEVRAVADTSLLSPSSRACFPLGKEIASACSCEFALYTVLHSHDAVLRG